jgi:hypothetical protein
MTSSLSISNSIENRRKSVEGFHASLAQLLPAAGSTTVSAKQLKGLQDAALALESLSCKDSTLIDACAPGAAAAVSSLELLLQQLLEPPAAVFSGFGGAPSEPKQEAEAIGGLLDWAGLG